MTRRESKLQYNEYSLHVCLDMQVGLGGDKWPAADLFCFLITSPLWIPMFNPIFDNKTVIDLGSGTGITGILLDKVYNPKEIVITDLDSHVEHIKYNILLNQEGRKVTSAFALDWFQPNLLDKKMDIILAFECVYKESLYEPFIKTLDALCHDKSLIFLGMTRNFMRSKFFKLLREHGYIYTLIPQNNIPNIEYRSNGSLRDTGLLICSKRV